jgi:hypothetical protein
LSPILTLLLFSLRRDLSYAQHSLRGCTYDRHRLPVPLVMRTDELWSRARLAPTRTLAAGAATIIDYCRTNFFDDRTRDMDEQRRNAEARGAALVPVASKNQVHTSSICLVSRPPSPACFTL